MTINAKHKIQTKISSRLDLLVPSYSMSAPLVSPERRKINNANKIDIVFICINMYIFIIAVKSLITISKSLTFSNRAKMKNDISCIYNIHVQ